MPEVERSESQAASEDSSWTRARSLNTPDARRYIGRIRTCDPWLRRNHGSD